LDFGGKTKMTQLGRVQTPTPRLLSLTNNADATTTSLALRTLVQIRPTLLHYVQDGVLMVRCACPPLRLVMLTTVFFSFSA
jgi:hypothetical protein